MRVVVAGSSGDVRAVEALAVGLRDAGHEAVVVESAEAVGIEAIAAAASGSDAVVGFSSAGPWAVSAAELVGAVGILAVLDPMLPTREFAPIVGGVRPPEKLFRQVGELSDAVGWVRVGHRVNRARRALGLGRMGNPVHHLPILWVPSDEDFVPDPALETFLAAGDRPICVSFYSMEGPMVEYAVESILEAYASTYRILLDSGEAGGRELPENVHRIRGVPDEWLFRRCGALVHESGAAKAHTAARAGIPSIPVPFTPQQRFWADRLYGSGAATKPVDPRSGWEAYKAALRETVPARALAAEIAAQMAGEDGVAMAVAAIQDLVSSRH
jgi:sterol 3beta-glucosyltransferase